jgi:ketosteroid isomerase-like protein
MGPWGNAMRYRAFAALIVAVALAASACAARTVPPETFITLERAALDRWGRGDPQGFLETYAPDVTYFDPFQPRRLDGLDTMKALYGPIKGQVRVSHYEMLAPLVQQKGDMAVLSYNLVSHATAPSGEALTVRWNSSTVYRRAGSEWKIIHSHWSFTTPPMNPARSP